MKRIGLIGGMSWESTVPYYQTINRLVQARLGGLHSADMLLYSVDFDTIARLQHAGDWAGAAKALVEVAQRLERAGAEGLVLATNTMHKVAPEIEAAVSIPLLHIADVTADALAQAGCATVGLLGTRFTMEQPFYADRLAQRHGVQVLTPGEEARAAVHRIIYDELCQGKIIQNSRQIYREVMAGLVAQGAQAIVLGCTEISLLVRAEDASVPLFDTLTIHAQAAVDWALAGDPHA